ncbi:hypothetical protein P7K49_025687 [Saguinus oedipus]|uniref:Uncharacterized protein n=1 Tax=Saguinus oedipus TaxID=9490 RepID=A0ABQ9UJB2_SAGOE|nr:hypothetical protein P7K49_025687 [Saguinus oedipus]
MVTTQGTELQIQADPWDMVTTQTGDRTADPGGSMGHGDNTDGTELQIQVDPWDMVTTQGTELQIQADPWDMVTTQTGDRTADPGGSMGHGDNTDGGQNCRSRRIHETW